MPLGESSDSLHGWHIISDIDLQGLDLKKRSMNTEADTKQTQDERRSEVRQTRAFPDKAVPAFCSGVALVVMLLAVFAIRRSPLSSVLSPSGWHDVCDGDNDVSASSGNQLVPGSIPYPTTDWNQTQYLPPGSSYSIHERMEKLEMESLRMQQQLKSHSAAISDMDGRIRALEAYIFGSSGTGVKGRLDSLKNQIDSLSKDVSQEGDTIKHIDASPSSTSLQMLQNSESLSTLREKVEYLELWLETLQHSSQTISSRLDSEIASITEDVGGIAERLHHVENHVHVSDELL